MIHLFRFFVFPIFRSSAIFTPIYPPTPSYTSLVAPYTRVVVWSKIHDFPISGIYYIRKPKYCKPDNLSSPNSIKVVLIDFIVRATCSFNLWVKHSFNCFPRLWCRCLCQSHLLAPASFDALLVKFNVKLKITNRHWYFCERYGGRCWCWSQCRSFLKGWCRCRCR